MIKYTSTTTFKKVEIDLANASLEQLLDAYNSFFEQSYSDAFPGSSECKKAEFFANKLKELVNARPEIVEYRKKLIDTAREERLGNKDILSI